MKRKILILVSVVLALTFALCACADDNTYTRINKLLNEDYSKVELTVSTTFDDETLTSTVTSTQNGDETTVKYCIRQYATFGDSVPENYVEETNGEIVVKNGKIVRNNGVLVGIDLEQATAKYNFNADYFIAPQMNGNVFSASVGNAKGFFGDTEFAGSGVKVSVTFSEVLESMQVTYTSQSGAKVELNYVFTK